MIKGIYSQNEENYTRSKKNSCFKFFIFIVTYLNMNNVIMRVAPNRMEIHFVLLTRIKLYLYDNVKYRCIILTLKSRKIDFRSCCIVIVLYFFILLRIKFFGSKMVSLVIKRNIGACSTYLHLCESVLYFLNKNKAVTKMCNMRSFK